MCRPRVHEGVVPRPRAADIVRHTPDTLTAATSVSTPPPDGGWGWVIVAASALAFFITGGFARSFTLVYQQLIVKFNASASSTAFVAALFGAVKLCSSPIVGGMCNKFGFQKVVITGGLISSFGMALSSFPTSLTFLYFSYGVITAFGTNMVITPSFVILGQYFRNRKAMAMSLATIGACFGGVAFPPLMEKLFVVYGYSGTMLIISGVMLNYCITGALYRPLKAIVEEKLPSEEFTETPKSNALNSVPVNVIDKVHDNTLMIDKRYSPIFIADQYSSRTDLVESGNKKKEPMQSCVLLIYHDVVPTTEVCVSDETTAAPKQDRVITALCRPVSNACCTIARYLGLPLLRNTHLSVFIILMVGSFICMGTSNTFLSALAAEAGIDTMHVATMLAISSGVNIPSRFLSGLIFDRPLVRRYRQPIFASVGLVVAVFAICMPISQSVVILSACCIGHCFFGSSFHAQHVTILSDIVGRRHLASAMGLCRFFQGIGIVIGPMVGGMLRDYFGDYSYAFYMGGSVLLVCTVMFQVYYTMRVTVPDVDETDESAPGAK